MTHPQRHVKMTHDSIAKCMALGHMTLVTFFYNNLSTFFIAILPLPSTTILFAILMFFAEIIAICKKFEVFTAEIPKLFDQIEKVSKNIYLLFNLLELSDYINLYY